MIAENELLSAANSIEAAAKKLAQLQPRLRPRVRVLVLMLLCVFICTSVEGRLFLGLSVCLYVCTRFLKML